MVRFITNRRFFVGASLLVLAIMAASCAPSVDINECAKDEPYGFLYGLLHGCIIFFSFIGSLFSDNIAIYAVNNNGGWYDFGYYLGIMFVHGGLGFGSKRRK